MDCVEARRLIDAGLRPSSTTPQRAALGFHLARCAGCRAYSAAAPQPPQLSAAWPAPLPLSDASALLLAALLEAPPEEPAAPLPVLSVARPTMARLAPRRPAPRKRAAPWWRYAVLGGLVLLVAGLAVGLGRLAMAAYTIGDNLAAMQVTTAPTIRATPGLLVPTGSPAPSSTPLPAAGVFDAAPAAPSVPPDAGVPTGDTTAAPAAPTPGPQLSATPVRLPPVGGPVALPTLMATVDVLPAVASGEPVTILLLGSDRRPGESWQTRSDAIMVVRLEPARQRVALLALPRDLIVSIPGYGQARINAATVYGDMYPELGGGAELARQTVSELLGLPINHVIRADFNAFITGINAIGGVDLVVEEELYDPQYPTMDYGYMEAYFAPGAQHMDGDTALIYSRMRHMDSNYARNRRQQQVLLAILQRVREQNILGQVQMLADLSTALRDDIQTDLSLDQMIGLAWAFRSLPPDQVERYALDETMVYEGGIPGDPYATLPNSGAIKLLVGQVLGTR